MPSLLGCPSIPRHQTYLCQLEVHLLLPTSYTIQTAHVWRQMVQISQVCNPLNSPMTGVMMESSSQVYTPPARRSARSVKEGSQWWCHKAVCDAGVSMASKSRVGVHSCLQKLLKLGYKVKVQATLVHLNKDKNVSILIWWRLLKLEVWHINRGFNLWILAQSHSGPSNNLSTKRIADALQEEIHEWLLNTCLS